MTTLQRVLFVSTLAVAVGMPAGGRGQEAKDVITVKLKLFDSNTPSKELIPEASTITLRNQATGKGQLLRDAKFVPVPGEKGFYQVQLPKGRLLEKMVIYVEGSGGTDYNAAVVSKLVTANNMVLYPGASDPGDPFSFTAYTAQLNEYKAIITQLLDEFGESQGEQIKAELKRRFRKQLLTMADAEKRGKLSSFTPEQLATARKLADEVLKLYGLREGTPPAPAPAPAPIVIIYYPHYPVYTCHPIYYQPVCDQPACYQPCFRRCGWRR